MSVGTAAPGRPRTGPAAAGPGRRGTGSLGPPRRAPRRPLRLLPLVPAVVLLLGFFAGPVVWAVYTATTNSALTGPYASHPESVGLANFSKALGDGELHAAVVRTLLFVVACVAMQNGLGLFLALLMQRRNRVVRALVSAVVVGAWIIPEIVAAFVWYSYLQPEGGTLNQILALFGLPGQAWLISSPLVSVILANDWRGSAFSMLIYNAALQDVPVEIVEAASVDGAGGLRRLWSIVLPTIRRTVSANLMLTTLSTLGVFGLIWAMTAGGPVNRSETLPVLMYDQAFNFGLLGYGSAISLVLLSLGAVFAIAYLILLRGDNK